MEKLHTLPTYIVLGSHNTPDASGGTSDIISFSTSTTHAYKMILWHLVTGPGYFNYHLLNLRSRKEVIIKAHDFRSVIEETMPKLDSCVEEYPFEFWEQEYGKSGKFYNEFHKCFTMAKPVELDLPCYALSADDIPVSLRS